MRRYVAHPSMLDKHDNNNLWEYCYYPLGKSQFSLQIQ